MKEEPILRPRLMAVASLIRRGSRVIDVGTDHALLPIYLALHGISDCVIASDVVPAPLTRGAKNVEKWGVSDRVTMHLGNGLDGLDRAAANDIVIAGMGGELIAQIIDAAPFVRDGAIRLILQPMTRAEVLRRRLGAGGFAIEEEVLVREDRIYQILVARYDGVVRTPSLFTCLVGEGNLIRGGELTKEHLARLEQVYSARLKGRNEAGEDTGEEEAVLQGVREAMEELG